MLNVLQKYARIPRTQNRTESVGTKLEKNLYDDWIDLCKSLGLTSSEAVRLLILETLLADKKEATSGNKSYKNLDDEIGNDNKNTSERKRSAKKKKKSTEEKKKSISDIYTVNKMLPCPVCKEWTNKKNFNRDHMKKHGFETREELFQTHMEVVEQMIKETKKGGQTDDKDTSTGVTE